MGTKPGIRTGLRRRSSTRGKLEGITVGGNGKWRKSVSIADSGAGGNLSKNAEGLEIFAIQIGIAKKYITISVGID